MQTESSITETPAAPPPVSSAPAPLSNVPAPAPATPAAAPTATPETNAAASATSGAQTPSQPLTEEGLRARLEGRVKDIFSEGQAEGAAQPLEATAPETPETPIVEPETPTPVEEPETEPIAAAAQGDDDLDTILDEAEFKKRYPRHSNQALIADITRREAQRGELQKSVRDIGGQPGLELAQALNPIVWKTDPTDEDAEKVFDQLIDPEKGAGAINLMRKMSTHFIQTGLYDETPSSVIGLDGKPVPVGALFASDLIKSEFGNQADGKTPYDLPFVNSVIQLHKSLGLDNGHTGTFEGEDEAKPVIDPARVGKPVSVATIEKLVKGLKAGHINMDYLEAELAGQVAHEPSEQEKAAIARAEAAEAKLAETAEQRTANEEAAKRKEDDRLAAYTVQSDRYTSGRVMEAVNPSIKDSGWAPQEGDSKEVLAQKEYWGRMVAREINEHMRGTPEAPSQAWGDYEAARKEGTVFTREGYPTPRFKVLLTPLENMAKAKFNEIKRSMGPAFRFGPSPSAARNARLATQNGSRNGEQPAVPPLAVVPKPRDPNVPLSFEEQRAELRRNLETKVRGQATAGVL